MTSFSSHLFAINVAVFLTMMNLGLSHPYRDVTVMWLSPKMFVRAFFAVVILVPWVALGVIALFRPTQPVAVALFALSMSPAAPLAINVVLKVKGDSSLWASMMLTFALLAPLTIPATMAWLPGPMHLDVRGLVETVLAKLLLPLTIGLVLRLAFPRWAQAAVGPLARGTALGIPVLMLVVLLPRFGLIREAGQGSWAAMLVFVVGSTLGGFALGGPKAPRRRALALMAGVRNPALAMVVVGGVYPRALPAVAATALVGALFNLGLVSIWKEQPEPAGQPAITLMPERKRLSLRERGRKRVVAVLEKLSGEAHGEPPPPPPDERP